MFPPLLLLQGAFLFGAVCSMPTSKKLFGEIKSPNYPKPYPDNNISTWGISVPKGFKVKLNFWQFDLEPSEACMYDYVKITANKKDLGRYCGQQGSTTGNHPGGKELLSTGNHMRLLFHSDFSNEENGANIFYKGFLAYYQAVDLDECALGNDLEDGPPQCQHFCHNYVGGYFCSCQPGYRLQSDRHSCQVDCSNELFTEPSGYLSSPGYPQPYPADMQCNYSIRVETGLLITLKFLEPFEIDDHQQVHCPYDQLKIQVGREEIGEFCGTVSPGSIETKGSSVDILFHTDDSGYSRGWKIRYSTERISCPQPVPNDEFTIIRDLQPIYRYQDYFIVTCTTGYKLMEGDKKLASFTSVCQDDGTWHRPMPQCEIVNCGGPKILDNGAFDYGTEPRINNYLSVVTYRCNEPYYRLLNKGGVTYTCSAQGSWKDQDDHEDIPVCLPVCGRPDNPIAEIQRIIDGRDAPRGSFPWQAKTFVYGRGGGALLGDRWILTAAHTLYPKGQEESEKAESPEQVIEKARVFLGHTEVNEIIRLGNQPVRRLFVHADYNPDNEENFDGDIALIELQDPVTLGRDMLPICLPDPGNDTFYVQGWMGYASGFGVEKNILASRLRYAPIPVARQSHCQEWLKGKKISDKDPVFTANMFCAGSPHEGKDTCQGDSGGAFAVRDPENGRWVVTGIVSWGIGCGKGYGFYTKVINYLDWIKGIVGKDWASMQVSY
ncbi:complement C1r subcomponent [Rhineura floridana]|uniref:complement C1r subcomponent n=1 Tax=Rhineura floridana TaxID=261503 RepID=UPI002AC8514A|nr:complement C1r subcomponent [Rhineura floridana]XP_061492661.1 complement C1r subcomponent [Rhineura floridana]